MDQVSGIERPNNGHSLPVLWASSAQSKSLDLAHPKLRPDVDFTT